MAKTYAQIKQEDSDREIEAVYSNLAIIEREMNELQYAFERSIEEFTKLHLRYLSEPTHEGLQIFRARVTKLRQAFPKYDEIPF
jgi:hypothetical protein